MFFKYLQRLLDLFFPRRCVLCDRILPMMPAGVVQPVCPECKKGLSYVREPFCMKCGTPLKLDQKEYCADCLRTQHHFTGGRAVFVYTGPMKESMYRFKYSGRREYADFFAKEALRTQGRWLSRIRPDCVIPVPLHRKKLRKRGYNQAEDFAAALAHQAHAHVDTHLVRRIRNTTPMKGLSAADRKKNVNGAFSVDEDRLQYFGYKRILIVDDIYTTGSTIDSIAKALTHEPDREIYFLCICTGQG